MNVSSVSSSFLSMKTIKIVAVLFFLCWKALLHADVSVDFGINFSSQLTEESDVVIDTKNGLGCGIAYVKKWPHIDARVGLRLEQAGYFLNKSYYDSATLYYINNPDSTVFVDELIIHNRVDYSLQYLSIPVAIEPGFRIRTITIFVRLGGSIKCLLHWSGLGTHTGEYWENGKWHWTTTKDYDVKDTDINLKHFDCAALLGIGAKHRNTIFCVQAEDGMLSVYHDRRNIEFKVLLAYVFRHK